MGVIILDKDGFTLDTDLSPEQSEKISAHIGSVLSRVHDVVNAGQAIKNQKQHNKKWSMGKLNRILISLDTVELLIIPNEEIGYTVTLLNSKIFDRKFV